MNIMFDTRKDFQFVKTENENLVFQFDRFIMRLKDKENLAFGSLKRMVTENAYHTLVTAIRQNQFPEITWNIMMIGIIIGALCNIVIMRFNRGTTEVTPEVMDNDNNWRNQLRKLYEEYTNPLNSIAKDYVLDDFSSPKTTIVTRDAVWAMLEATRMIDECNTPETMMSTWFNYVFRKMEKNTNGEYKEVENFGTVDLLENYCGYRFGTADMRPQMAFIPNVVLIEPR